MGSEPTIREWLEAKRDELVNRLNDGTSFSALELFDAIEEMINYVEANREVVALQPGPVEVASLQVIGDLLAHQLDPMRMALTTLLARSEKATSKLGQRSPARTRTHFSAKKGAAKATKRVGKRSAKKR